MEGHEQAVVVVYTNGRVAVMPGATVGAVLQALEQARNALLNIVPVQLPGVPQGETAEATEVAE